MENIHIKTVDPLSQELLRSAAGRNLDLTWERYEKLQPRDGFLRVGLSCPYGCMQGPCRIDPFGRGADRGICGLDRDGMAAAFLLRLCVNGALEALPGSTAAATAVKPENQGPLKPFVAKTLDTLGGGDLGTDEIFQAASLLHRPGDGVEALIRRALRLGILALTQINAPINEGNGTNPGEKTFSCKAGYGLLAGDDALIGVCGEPSEKAVERLLEEAETLNPGVRVVSLGGWVPAGSGFLPFACTSGETELVISSGRINLLLCGPGTDPAIRALAEKLSIPVVFSNESHETGEMVRRALAVHGSASIPGFSPDAFSVETATIDTVPAALKEALKSGSGRQLALLGGWDIPSQPLGWIPSETAPALGGAGFQVAGWGDAAVWMLKRGLAREDAEDPVRILHPDRGLPEIISAVAESGSFDPLGGICFTGLKKCRDLVVAMGLASLGVRVNIASPVPLWGSKTVQDCLDRCFAAQGGSLTHYDHPAAADEILNWFMK